MNKAKKWLIGCGGCVFLFIIGIIFIGISGNKIATTPTKAPEATVTIFSSPSPTPTPTPTLTTTPTPTETVKVESSETSPPAKPQSNCDPNYSGACVPVASDVDCAGGGGNGPAYVQGPVQVIGRDIYGLDRDGNGVGCE